MGCTSSSSIIDIYRTVVKTGSTIVVWSISEPERELIKQTWKRLSRRLDEVGAAVFLEIFRRRPDIHQIFEFRHVAFDNLTDDSRFKRHVNKVMQTIGALVDNIADVDTVMAPVLLDIGKHHYRFNTGFDHQLCDVFMASILKTWRDKLGRKYNADVDSAWKQLFEFSVVKIEEGYRSETIENVAEY